MTEVPFKTRAWEFWRRNQLLFLHLPVLLFLLFGGYAVLKSIDSRIGVEGFGDLFGYLLNAVRVAMILFTAWWMKKWLWFDLHDRTELELFQKAKGVGTAVSSHGEAWMAFWLVARDRVEWVIALGFATYWFTR